MSFPGNHKPFPPLSLANPSQQANLPPNKHAPNQPHMGAFPPGFQLDASQKLPEWRETVDRMLTPPTTAPQVQSSIPTSAPPRSISHATEGLPSNAPQAGMPPPGFQPKTLMAPGDRAKSSENAPKSYKVVAQVAAHAKSVSSIKFSPCGFFLATSSADKLIKIWRVEDLHCMKILVGNKLGVNEVSWSFDSNWLASASDDKTVRIFNVDSGACVKTLCGHTNYVFCCSFNPQSSLIASGGFDESLRVWDVRSGKCMRIIPAHSDPITAVAFDRRGSIIASSSYDGYIRLWDVGHGECLRSMASPDQPPVGYIRFTPNGSFIFSSTFDNKLTLWDHAKGKSVKEYVGHKNEKYCLFSGISTTNEKCFISGSEDGKIFIWDIQKKTIVQVAESHTEAVLAIDVHPTRNIFVSAGLEPDHQVRVWKKI